jgi:hypothetical protein
MLVFRVEDGDGTGPYTDGALKAVWRVISAHNSSYYHTGIYSDVDMFTYKHKCGCSSIEQLVKWFHGWAELLNENGYLLVVYSVAEEFVLHGRSGRQLAFDSRFAKKLCTLEWDKLDEY